MTQLIDWTVAHGVEIGCGMLALALILIGFLLVSIVRNRYDDDFEPIGQPVQPARRLEPFDPRNTRNHVNLSRTLVQPPLT